MNKKRDWPKIKKCLNHGKPVYVVDARIKGQGERKFFDTLKEAEGWQQIQRVRRQNEGGRAFDDRELAVYGWNIQDAVKFALAHLRQQAESKPIKDAVAALVDFKRGRVGEIRLADIENRLARFTAACGEKTVAQVTPDEINAFLAGIPHPTTRNDYRKEIVMLWHFCRARKWVSEALDKTHVPREAEPEKGRMILTIEQGARLMEASVDPDICALNAMILFGGLRREEVEKLDWAAVNFRTGHIEVSAEVSKVARERFAPMPDNLRAWLMPLAKKKGPVVSRVLMHALRATWKRAGLYPWPQDAHRHSFISYRRRIIGDAQTALDAGTSETIIKRHYKRPVTLADAERYFSIMPSAEAGEKIVAITAA
jgi:integrase